VLGNKITSGAADEIETSAQRNFNIHKLLSVYSIKKVKISEKRLEKFDFLNQSIQLNSIANPLVYI